ncbi:MAG: PadR family transcriptional regulator [Proteobacteria bacterium]|nr:PadR family transcriptional regulator [Pseudomonadota bacterium]MBI3499013.1 PadR family transcriptional regulator [Pseudomonadota bacterium]
MTAAASPPEAQSEPTQVQLKKGVLELCVLALLARGDNYAYEIASRLSRAIDMGEGTIYPLMRRIERAGLVATYLVQSDSGPARKYYKLTKTGRAHLAALKAEWNSFARDVAAILGDS